MNIYISISKLTARVTRRITFVFHLFPLMGRWDGFLKLALTHQCQSEIKFYSSQYYTYAICNVMTSSQIKQLNIENQGIAMTSTLW